MPQERKVKKETPALPTSEELRHQYGDTTHYVKGLAARAKRSAERAGADKKRSKDIDEELKIILGDLDQALKEDVESVEAGRKPYTHVDLESIMKKDYSSFADLTADYFDDEDKDETKDEKSKAKSFYLIDGKTLTMDDPTAIVVVAAAISAGKPIQKLELKDDGTPEITTIVEGKKKKSKVDDDDDPDEAGGDDDVDDGDEETAGAKKLKIKFGGKKISVPVITRTSGSGKSKKTRTYALASADGTEVFTSFADANDSDDPVVWYELARVTVGVKADGSEKFNYELATDSPATIKYLKG